MTSAEQAPTLDHRELLNSLDRALERRHEVCEAIIDSTDRADASRAVQRLLGIPEAHAEAVVGLPLWRLNRQDRRRTRQELEDANTALHWTPEGSGRGAGLRLRPFGRRNTDTDLFRQRATEKRDDGTTLYPEERIDSELEAGLQRIDDEAAAWFVAEDAAAEQPECVGLVIGEQVGHDVEVRVWVRQDCRQQGLGTAALKQCRGELAAYFPGSNLIVRTPLHGSPS